MAKKKTLLSPAQQSMQDLPLEQQELIQVQLHYRDWTQDNNTRRTRPNGWDAVTDAYWGKLPADWPYQSRVIDPRIRTSIIEKDARLLNKKLQGRLVARKGDVLAAKLQNAILDYQWDTANNGGTMLAKWADMSQDARLYASRFALVKWRHVEDEDGNVIFDGNEFAPIDIRDCGMDSNCTHIRNASWFQHREWAKIEDLQTQSDMGEGKPLYPGLANLISKMGNGDRRDNQYPNRVLQNKSLTDRVGTDRSYPLVEIVTEYRCDKWIKFSPRHNVIIQSIPNPYVHRKIPIVQLRYQSLTGDPLGESEVEPVLPLWRAIQATLCGFLDSMNIHIRPPLKIIEASVRLESIVFGAEAQWLVDRQDAIEEFQSSGDALQFFEYSYSSLVSAFNTAMGDTSQGTSNLNPFNKGGNTTATEINSSNIQQNNRDQKNQTSLAESMEDMMMMWQANNRQFLLADADKKPYILEIVGSEIFNYFQRMGLHESGVGQQQMQMLGDIVKESGGNLTDDDIMALTQGAQSPLYPIYENPDEQNPDKLLVKPKMSINDMGDKAMLHIVPEDLEGEFNYVADVKSMAAGDFNDTQAAKQKIFDSITQNPVVLQLLQQEGVQPQIKELLITLAEDAGYTDAERFFTPTQNNQAQTGQQGAPGQPTQGASPTTPFPQSGLPNGTPSIPPGGGQNPFAQSARVPNAGGFPQSLQYGLQ
jgi:hypothetical protein